MGLLIDLSNSPGPREILFEGLFAARRFVRLNRQRMHLNLEDRFTAPNIQQSD